MATLAFTSCKNEAKNEAKTETTEMSKDMAMAAISFGVRR
tara:strand:+ start:1159 stop:1278 length:120 start_codon:yes stop_codon:yes gene_type:complete